MKFISLGRKRSLRGGQLDKLAQATPEHSIKPTVVPHEIHTYTELRHQIHNDLRIQHPEWVQANGESPMCDSYESRFVELIDSLTPTGSNESIDASHRAQA